MDHCSDPLGTESHNVQLDKKKDLRIPKVDLLEAVY